MGKAGTTREETKSKGGKVRTRVNEGVCFGSEKGL